MPLEREIKRGPLRHRHGSQPFYEWRLADFVLTTKHLIATTGSGELHREALRCSLRTTSILPPRGEDGIELEVMARGEKDCCALASPLNLTDGSLTGPALTGTRLIAKRADDELPLTDAA